MDKSDPTYPYSMARLAKKKELDATLLIITLYAQPTGDIVALLRSDDESTCEQSATTKDSRTLVKDYVGFEINILLTTRHC